MEGDEAGVASRQREAESQHIMAEEAAGERYVGAIPEVGERRPDGVGAGQLRGQEAAEGGGPGRVQGGREGGERRRRAGSDPREGRGRGVHGIGAAAPRVQRRLALALVPGPSNAEDSPRTGMHRGAAIQSRAPSEHGEHGWRVFCGQRRKWARTLELLSRLLFCWAW